MNYKLTISYDGTGYLGWQLQGEKPTIQKSLNTALEILFGQKIITVASGRTDAGVHALNQVVQFNADKIIEPRKVVNALNFYLPDKVRVKAAEYVGAEFSAIRDAKQKTYMYLMYLDDTDNPLMINRALRLDKNIDIEKMRQSANMLLGSHDFTSFMSTGSSAKTFVRNIFKIEIVQSEQLLKLFITADGFLYNMVRIIVSQLVKAGQGKLKMDIAQILEGKDRALAKEIAPAYGLYLYNVEY